MRFLFIRTVGLLGLVALGACEERNPESCAADNFCVDPDRPFCDIDGSVAGEPGKCVAVSCTASAFEKCRGDDALVCNEAGNDFNLTECANGCDPEAGCRSCPAGASDCLRITPRYLPTVCTTPATQASLVVSNSTTIDTDQMSSCTAVIPQIAGPGICVLRYDAIAIEQAQTVSVTGSRALALVADHDLRIDGTLDVSANGRTSGPAGALIKSGDTEGGGGGGGAGYRHPGGAGGTEAANGGAANGGMAAQSAALAAELLGGRSAAPKAGTLASPGGAGGAVTLISCRGQVVVRGIIDAGGGGGRGGSIDLSVPSNNVLPGGGGSGGTIALQGASIRIEGGLFANGGAGGGGAQPPSIAVGDGRGTDGNDGTRSSTVAGPGVGSPSSGNGGAGGAAQPPTEGQRRVVSGGGHGGGGGSAGYILLFTPEAAIPTLALSATISPPAEPKLTVALTP